MVVVLRVCRSGDLASASAEVTTALLHPEVGHPTDVRHRLVRLEHDAHAPATRHRLRSDVATETTQTTVIMNYIRNFTFNVSVLYESFSINIKQNKPLRADGKRTKHGHVIVLADRIR